MEPNAEGSPSTEHACTGGHTEDWTWPPYAPVEPAEDPRFLLDEWAPPSTVRHPWLRVGRWTLLYRRAA